MMDRRAFIEVLAGSLVVAQSVAEAQPAAKVYRIGLLSLGTVEAQATTLRVLSEGLRDLGYVEGRNLMFERRYADGNLERLPGLAAELVRLRVDVIVASGNPIIAAAKRATTLIPIVMVAAVDPVGDGFITSLARPGGNITGLSLDASLEIYSKNLATLTEIVPGLSRVGLLRQPETGFELTEMKESAGPIPARRELRCEDSRRRQARRTPGRAAGGVRTSDQSEDGEGARPRDPSSRSVARG